MEPKTGNQIINEELLEKVTGGSKIQEYIRNGVTDIPTTKSGYAACFVNPDTGWQSIWVGPYEDEETAMYMLGIRVSITAGRWEIKTQYIPGV